MAQKQLSWIRLLDTKRSALYSTVVVVESNDHERVRELISALDGLKKPILIWDTYAGLLRHECIGGTATESIVAKPDDLMQNPVQMIGALLMKESESNWFVIMKNFLDKSDLPQKAINYWATADPIFEKVKTVVIFVPDKSVIDNRVLEKCILVTPPLSLTEERYTVLETLLEKTEKEIRTEDKEALVTLTSGLDLNQTEAVFSETIREFTSSGKLDLSVVARTKADSINKSGVCKVIVNVDFGFESVGGYEAVKQYIRETLINPLKDPEKAREMGVEPPRGAILFGPPGTGKTILAKAISKELDMPFVILNPENFMSSYVGETERNLAKAIQIIETMSPCIVFIDEIDKLGGRGASGENDGGTMRRAFSMLLEYLGDERRKAIVIGATNMPNMDDAFRREGRFDVLIPMLSPDEDARKEILKIHLNVRRKVKHSITQNKLDEIAKISKGWKGNMLEELVRRATRLAFNEGKAKVSDKDLQEAYDDYQIPDTLQAREAEYVKLAEELCNSKKFLEKLKKSTILSEGSARSKLLDKGIGFGT